MPLVSRLEQIACDTWMLYWKKEFHFRAGQVIPLALQAEGPARFYSLATGENEEAGILFQLVPEGYLTPKLKLLKPGSRFWVGEPQGSFTAHQEACVWICNGTGIAPFLSMIASKQGQGQTLIHGARSTQGFFFQEKLSQLPGLDYIRCISQVDGLPTPGVYLGRLTSFLREKEWNNKKRYYLCGSSAMIVEVRDILLQKGISYRKIISEVYF